MADVVVNITGNASGLQNTMNQVSNQASTTPSGGGVPTGSQGQGLNQSPGGALPAMPTYDRMSQDIRREIMNRGVMMVPGSANFNQFMNTVQQQQKDRAYQALDAKYDVRVDRIQQDRRAEEDKIRQDIDAKRHAALANATDSLQIQTINRNFDNVLAKRLGAIDKKYSPLYDQLDNEYAKEKEQLDKDLTQVMRDLVDELKRGNPNSYLGQLRGQYREAIWKRDNAETEEEARAAAREAAEIEQRMTKAMGRQNPLQRIGAGWGTFTSIAAVGMNAYESCLPVLAR